MECYGGVDLSTPEDVIKYCSDHGVKSIRLWFTDLLGFLKSFAVTLPEIEGAFEEGMGFDGSSIEGYKRIQESDMVAFPIAPTAQVIPFKIGGSRSIRMFAEVRNPDGSAYASDPREVLKRNLASLKDFGFAHMNIGPEAEYYYFADEDRPSAIDRAGYFDINPVDLGDDLREATVFALESMGIPVEYMHHEVAPSQHEIDLKYQEALRMADGLQTYKYLVKEIARRNGVYATFMPKPLFGENGSGMHTHLSIFKDEKTNAFYSKEKSYHLSATAKRFLAGVLDHAREIALITNQWYNSYKRLVVGFEAPVYIAWAERNRSALIRVPMYKPGKEAATRIELRFPDAACNPYLAFSVMLTAGLDGLERELRLPDPMTQDLYELTPVERERLGVLSLPHDLYEAVQVAEGSDLLVKTLGEDVLNKILETKLADDEKFRLYISPLDLEHHLEL
ncbi:MAG: glutamine synthetase [Gemmatimonadetes bacterium]|nr:glutamine synthetase [Gemmatimonadota bacterium]NIO30549.1 glutamine synthetase [Gemmatimonadota bacterium]